MIDVEIIRQNPEIVRKSIQAKDGDVSILDEFMYLDNTWRKLLSQIEDLRRQQKELSKTKPSDNNFDKARQLKLQITQLTETLSKIDNNRLEVYAKIPNIILNDVPIGPGETATKVVSSYGNPQIGEYLEHFEILEKNNLINTEQAVKMCGSRFRYYLGDMALWHMRLLNQAVEFAVSKGFLFISPPILSKQEPLFGTGYLPTFSDEIFKTEDGYYLHGTSEPMLVSLYGGRTLKNTDLPIRLVGRSTCLRREAGSYGKDTKGVFRQHQFDKVEMVSIVSPEKAEEEHQYLLSVAQEFVEKYDIAYQTVLIGSGDLGPATAKKYDIEAWFPGQKRYRETHSISNCTDYQARRLRININTDGQNRLAYTLNGTLATDRLLLALIEQKYNKKGHLDLPKNLLG